MAGKPSDPAAAALLACALRHPVDVTEGVAVVQALGQMLDSRDAVRALTALSECHPARTVRRASRTLLRAGGS
ncbi:hypothetical protein [Methylococcus geothermalis]|uniref:HEAT repeat domain-containing protein n=1 Tax=Methylococcus geothermalis TaxID=2681310 RepID=A0A858Q9I6_9GAMM|nr:hypothetical protein [Methylococcus geothermalis]QJD30568.1 hypothetical protein GNH96_11660 [Methylococcus geothermalis]